MKARLLILFIVCGSLCNSQIYFPDANLKQALLNNGVDQNFDQEIDYNEAFAWGTLNLAGYNITNLSGLELFSNLGDLDISNNPNISNFNLSFCPGLIHLYCSGCNLTTLDVSLFKSLDQLTCSNNQLTSLDLSSLSTLAGINCSNNQLSSLDVSQFNLASLNCSNNIALLSVCVADVNAASINSNFIKDNATQWTSSCITKVSNIQQNDIMIYPNPVRDVIHIPDNYVSFEILNSVGEIVSKSFVNIIDVSALNEGVYFLKAYDSDGTIARAKFIRE
jgi:Leucine-rich repeat (LRR) protein